MHSSWVRDERGCDGFGMLQTQFFEPRVLATQGVGNLHGGDIVKTHQGLSRQMLHDKGLQLGKGQRQWEHSSFVSDEASCNMHQLFETQHLGSTQLLDVNVSLKNSFNTSMSSNMSSSSHDF